jgi:hypothetical protein
LLHVCEVWIGWVVHKCARTFKTVVGSKQNCKNRKKKKVCSYFRRWSKNVSHWSDATAANQWHKSRPASQINSRTRILYLVCLPGHWKNASLLANLTTLAFKLQYTSVLVIWNSVSFYLRDEATCHWRCIRLLIMLPIWIKRVQWNVYWACRHCSQMGQ